MSPSHRRLRLALRAAVLLSAIAGSAHAQRDTAVLSLPPMTITRDVSRSPLELPFAVSATRPDSMRPGQMHAALDDAMLLLPGVTVANRDNPSQDPRVSVRGFGARSAFGVRSIRIMRDGMPLTLPDGQTPVDYLDLESVGSVEAIRGTSSSLYGNASGGIINLRSGPPPVAPVAVQARSWLGSYGLQRVTGVTGGTLGVATYEANVGRTTTDDYRQFSHQRLTNGYGRATLDAAGTTYELQVMGVDEPLAENPGALTLAQLDTAPRMADPLSVAKRARKVVHQLQVGTSAHHALADGGEVSAQLYGGTRALYNPLTFAVVGVDRRSGGAGVRGVIPTPLGEIAARFTIGVDGQQQSDFRKNWVNCNAVPTANASCPGAPAAEKGRLTLDQQEIVSSVGPYAREEVPLGRVTLSGGLRQDWIRFQVRDRYLADGRDDSGAETMGALSPMFATLVRLDDRDALYFNVASAFETPTTTELGNHPDGSAGLNPDLKPQYSTTYETGLKGFAFSRLQYDMAVFDIEVRDELIPFEVAGSSGRTYYRNAGRTRRAGAELGLSTYVGPLELGGSYTFSSFHFVHFRVDTNEFAGNAIPGIPRQQVEGSVTWRVGSAYVVAEGLAKSELFANDANTARAPGFAVANLRIGGTAILGWPWFSPVLALENVLDRRYAGSVAVNASGATLAQTKFYEPAPGRTIYFGLTVAGGR